MCDGEKEWIKNERGKENGSLVSEAEKSITLFHFCCIIISVNGRSLPLERAH
jgi:hypothetical protein